MLTTVEGIYKNGRVELLENPSDVQEVPVLVTFLESKPIKAPVKAPEQMLQYGKYAGSIRSTEGDFKIAEWNGEPEFDD